jgi:hypothetical protein
MFGFHSTILSPIDTTSGENAFNYTNLKCPVMSLMCIRSSGEGVVKLTPLSAANIEVQSQTGGNARMRIKCNTAGEIVDVEVANGGNWYEDGVHETIVHDPNGSGAKINVIASNGKIVSCEIVEHGRDYSGYIVFGVDDFIEGVTYNIIPRYIEKEGSGTLILLGCKSTTIPVPFNF